MLNNLFRLFGFLALLGPAMVFGQFVDDFSDGDFTVNPVWGGDVSLFVVENEQLRSNSLGEATYYLSTESTVVSDVEWQFFFDFQFGTSGANFCDVFLIADNADLNNVTNGYFVRIGGTADEISLYNVVGGSESLLIDGVDGLVNSSSSNPFVVKVTRSSSDEWRLEYDDGAIGTFVLAGTLTDNAVNASTHFGFLIEQSSAASPVNGHFFDDISVGPIPVDNIPPELDELVVLSNTELEVTFTEPLSLTSAELVANYSADGGLGNPAIAVLSGTDPTVVNLTFGQSFNNGTTYQLTVENVEDLAGNPNVSVTEPFTYVIPSPAGFRDVVINEFICDPTPFVGLAEAEFVELFNTSSNYIDISGWKLGDASSFGTIGSHIIGPGEYALLVSTTSSNLFTFYPNVVEVTSFPSLNNSGDDIILQDANEVVIDELTYDLTWYQDEAKEDGGYSIEQINPYASCVNSNNWAGSNDVLGGTPSAQNSVFDDTPDTDGPNLTGIVIIDNQNVEVNLDESLDVGSVSNTSVSVEPSLAVATASASGSSIVVSFSNPMDTGVVYTLTLLGVQDCELNPQTEDSVGTFILPFEADSGSFVINEVLFNPYTGGSDYVELVNNTDRPINLKGWLLANYDDEDGLSNHKTITSENYSVDAGGYVLITEDTSDVMMNYIQHGINNFIEADMPSYNNDSGTVYLLTPDSLISEFFSYNEDMHFSLLSDVDGVSLERLDVNRDVSDRGNWHSAAQTSGFGTPGLVNSQFFPTQQAVGEVSVDPELFSPRDGNGNDLVNINYNFPGPGYVGTVRIFDSNGRPVRQLATNQLLANQGTFTWDGTTDGGELARIGMYIILFEAFSESGDKSVHKLSVALGGRL
jgi:hypothetical protein